MAIPQTLGERLRFARERAKLDQSSVAETLGVHAKSISKWENDRQEPGEERLAQLAELYEVETWWLRYGVRHDSEAERLAEVWERERKEVEHAREAYLPHRGLRAHATAQLAKRAAPPSVLAYVHRAVADFAERGATEEQLEAVRRFLTSRDGAVLTTGSTPEALTDREWLDAIERLLLGLQGVFLPRRDFELRAERLAAPPSPANGGLAQ